MVTVTFKGGPRNGQQRQYERNPRSIGCVDEWKAAGMKRGLYRVPKNAQGPDLIANWVEV